MTNDIPSEIPKPPRAIGISKRLLISIMATLFVVIVLFLIMLNHYTPKPNNNVSASNPLNSSQSSMNSDSVDSLIHHIQHQGSHPMIIKLKAANNHTADRYAINANNATLSQPMIINNKAFTEGSNSSLSVFHENTMNANPMLSTLQTANSNDTLNKALIATAPAAKDTYTQQNMQTEKTAFLHDSRAAAKATISSKLRRLISPFELQAGSLIPATLITGIDSSLPGPMIASVRENVFDSATGNYLLIPQGTKLIGSYDSRVSYGQTRVLIVWSRLIFPNGSSFDLKGMPGADLLGLSGLHDKVDNHYFKVFGSALMFSIFGAASQLSQPQNNSSQLTSQQIIAGAIGQQLSQTAMQLVARNMNIQPTINIRPGNLFNVLLTRDMVLPHPYHL